VDNLNQPAGQPGLFRRIPGLALLRSYDRSWLKTDLVAGATVFAVLVPSGLAYGDLAGLAPAAGLYAALAAMVAYALFGTSRQMVIGPEATSAILVATAIAPLAGGDPLRHAALAGMLAILVGLICFAAAALRLGFLTDFLSQPILTGYITGTALIVMASQLGKLLGIRLERDDPLPQVLEALRRLDEVSPLVLGMGLATIAALLILRRALPKVPGTLVVVALAVVLSSVFGLAGRGIAVVGAIPAGLPRLAIPAVGVGDILALVPTALSLALLIIADAVLTGRSFAQRHGYRVDANQELVALGAANLSTGLLQAFPTAASSSRSAVNDASGARSQLSALTATALLVLFLVAFTGLLASLPTVVLGAIIVVSAANLVDVAELRRLWRVRRDEFRLAVLTLAGVLLVGIVPGILVAVTVALFNLISRIYRPSDATLDDLEGVDGFQPVVGGAARQAELGLLVYRFDAPLIFANAPHFGERVAELAASAQPPLRRIVVSCDAMTDLDITGADALKRLHGELAERRVGLGLARVRPAVAEMLRRTGLEALIGAENIYPSVRSAVRAYVEEYP
jgi:sulfate permease, SulP family